MKAILEQGRGHVCLPSHPCLMVRLCMRVTLRGGRGACPKLEQLRILRGVHWHGQAGSGMLRGLLENACQPRN